MNVWLSDIIGSVLYAACVFGYLCFAYFHPKCKNKSAQWNGLLWTVPGTRLFIEVMFFLTYLHYEIFHKGQLIWFCKGPQKSLVLIHEKLWEPWISCNIACWHMGADSTNLQDNCDIAYYRTKMSSIFRYISEAGLARQHDSKDGVLIY